MLLNNILLLSMMSLQVILWPVAVLVPFDCCVILAVFIVWGPRSVVIRVPATGQSGCSQFLSVTNKATVSVGVPSLCVDTCFHFACETPESEVLDNRVCVCLTFKKVGKLTFKV